MHSTLITLIDRLDSFEISATNVIRWGSPVPSFGDLSNSQIATIGLNPSNREFVNGMGEELKGDSRRFHTLESLGLRSWSEVDARHLQMILETCKNYFFRNPYDGWFKKLDQIISGTSTSYYHAFYAACHLDLIPFATECKWNELTPRQRSLLLSVAGDTLGLLLRESSVRVIILNGMSVVQLFQEIADISLERREMVNWALPRQIRSDVAGIAFRGEVESLSGIALGRKVQVLGYNHNIQSSFGVTKKVIYAIRDWITQVFSEENYETP